MKKRKNSNPLRPSLDLSRLKIIQINGNNRSSKKFKSCDLEIYQPELKKKEEKEKSQGNPRHHRISLINRFPRRFPPLCRDRSLSAFVAAFLSVPFVLSARVPFRLPFVPPFAPSTSSLAPR